MKNLLLTILVIVSALTSTLFPTPDAPVEESLGHPAEAAEDPRTNLAAPIALSELSPEVETIALDFEDFTLSLPADTACRQGVKADGQVLLILYETMPTGRDVTANVSVVWNAQPTAYSDDLAETLASETEQLFPLLIEQYRQQGLALSNMQLLSVSAGSFGNLPSVDILTTYDVDYTGKGLDIQTNLLALQRTMCLGDKGVYIFTITAEDLSECVRLSSILNTLAWKE